MTRKERLEEKNNQKSQIENEKKNNENNQT